MFDIEVVMNYKYSKKGKGNMSMYLLEFRNMNNFLEGFQFYIKDSLVEKDNEPCMLLSDALN